MSSRSVPPQAATAHESGAAPSNPPFLPTPGLIRRFASGLYESILLFGVVFIPAYLFSALLQFKGGADSPLRHAFQLYMFGAIGFYFTWCWKRSGQTLPMKTWKFALLTAQGQRVSTARAWLRYTLVWIGPLVGVLVYKAVVELGGHGSASFSFTGFLVSLPFLLLNWLWAWVDRERQFLHDRLARTRLVSVTR
jgi:uncharacterized RDD family membrane protein YckC